MTYVILILLPCIQIESRCFERSVEFSYSPVQGRQTRFQSSMRRVALIYNPASGQHSARRDSYVQKVLAILRQAGIDAEPLETHAPGSGRSLALAAVRQGFDAVLACGGDGTVHEVLQPLVG